AHRRHRPRGVPPRCRNALLRPRHDRPLRARVPTAHGVTCDDGRAEGRGGPAFAAGIATGCVYFLSAPLELPDDPLGGVAAAALVPVDEVPPLLVLASTPSLLIVS